MQGTMGNAYKGTWRGSWGSLGYVPLSVDLTTVEGEREEGGLAGRILGCRVILGEPGKLAREFLSQSPFFDILAMFRCWLVVAHEMCDFRSCVMMDSRGQQLELLVIYTPCSPRLRIALSWLPHKVFLYLKKKKTL